MKTSQLKPYLFIAIIFAIPMLMIPVIKMAKSTSALSDAPAKKQPAVNVDKTKGIYAIAIHGGAGNFTKDDLSSEQKIAYKKALYEVLERATQKLEEGADAVDVVESAIQYLEDDSLFNAGRGAVLTNSGLAELDASIMTGEDLNAGAVAGVRTVKNPIKAARKVMDSSNHVMLSGRGAEEFCKLMKLEIVPNEYFITQKSTKRLSLTKKKHGTVGCVVLDMHGNIAAGTSTGGMNNKKYGRIGDSPVIGAGTYADNRSCGISCTGYGEYFIRLAVAHEISALMRYKDLQLQEAADYVVKQRLGGIGGYGGIIGVDPLGNIAVSYNTKAMFRAFCDRNGEHVVRIFNQ